MSKAKVHLVLGSGGARGVAHIGVIEVLEEKGYEIISVTGCSMGAVVGGIYAAGFQQDYKDWLLSLTKPRLLQVMDFTLSNQGFLKGERIFSLFEKVSGPLCIEQLNVPFIAVAADMAQNQEVHYRTGDLYKALRASIAIPGVFTPVIENGQFLVDGGVLNPLPVNTVVKKGQELVVAVNLNGVPENQKDTSAAQEKKVLRKLFKPIMDYATSRMKEGQSTAEYSLRELLLSTYRMTQDRITALMLQAYPPDVLIEIPRNACSTFEFYKSKTLLELGRQACMKKLALS